MMKGISLVPGQVVVLALDGTLVYVEHVETTFVAVVALPEQPPNPDMSPAFTPGAVRAKKISPFATAKTVVEVKDLSERNKNFIATYEQLRAQDIRHVDRTPDEQAAHDLAMNPPDKATVRAQAKADKAAAKVAKPKSGPRYLQRCATCNEQQGHPNHPGDHAFVAPPLPAVLCAACDKDADDAAHQPGGSHRFVGGKAPKPAREPRAPKPEKAPGVASAPRAPKASLPSGTYRWVDNAERLNVLRACNGKYNEGNSGNAVIELIKAGGDAGLAPVAVVGLPKCPGTLERAQLAFQQLLGAGLLEEVK